MSYMELTKEELVEFIEELEEKIESLEDDIEGYQRDMEEEEKQYQQDYEEMEKKIEDMADKMYHYQSVCCKLLNKDKYSPTEFQKKLNDLGIEWEE